jgi:predicted PurR-regulated permease PerM
VDPDRVFYARVFTLVALALLAWLLWLILGPFLRPIAWALFIAFLLYPVQRGLTRRLRGRASLSAALLTVAMIFLIIGPLAGLGATFGREVGDLARQAQAWVAEHKPAQISAEFADLVNAPVIGPALSWVQENAGVSFEQIQGWTVDAMQTVLKEAGSLGRAVFVGALGTVIGFAVMIFILFFAIRDGREWLDDARALVPASPQDRSRLFGHLAAVLRAMVYGTGVTALVQGVLVAIGFAIVGLPSPVVFGVLAAIAALVPLVGTPAVWVPATLVLALQGRYGAALFMGLWGGFVVTIDNFLRPWLVSGRADVGTLTVFIGVLGGVGAVGPGGGFLGALVLARVVALVRFTREEKPA